MPFLKHTSASSKLRILISGLPNTGKTTSLATFIYGQHDINSDDEAEVTAALEYAGDRRMAILTCPGEFGTRSLPDDLEHVSSFYYESDNTDNINSAEYSKHAISDFYDITTKIKKEKVDILAVEGLHNLWSHLMNRNTDGDYLAGHDLNINPATGRNDPYRGAKYYNQTHNVFGNYVADLYQCSIPLIIATTWEEWESGTAEGQRPGDIAATRYLWPSIPGAMAKGIVGRYDARLSARIERRCLHTTCVDSKESKEHHVWQFMSKNDVQGVGIKGMRRVSQAMKDRPFIHQNGEVLMKLMDTCK